MEFAIDFFNLGKEQLPPAEPDTGEFRCFPGPDAVKPAGQTGAHHVGDGPAAGHYQTAADKAYQ